MRKRFGLALLALPLLAAAAQAGPFGPYKIEAGANVYFRVKTTPSGYPNGGVCGPWYNYWPLDAQAQLPGSPHYPYYPGPQGANKPGPDAYPPAPAPAPPEAPPPGIRPASYTSGLQATGCQGHVPNYWYGR